MKFRSPPLLRIKVSKYKTHIEFRESGIFNSSMTKLMSSGDQSEFTITDS
jgi:hypothetical protein